MFREKCACPRDSGRERLHFLRRISLAAWICIAVTRGVCADTAAVESSDAESVESAAEFATPDIQQASGPSAALSDESFRELPEPPGPPLGAALFSGQNISLAELFVRDKNPIPKAERPWPDISDPGPDLGDYPNSAYTLPKGRCYIETTPLTLSGPDSEGPASYILPFLFRYGVTDDVEFRLFGSSITHIFGDSPTTGLSPLNIDLKVHLWDDRREWLLPAASLEVYVQTTWGSPQFNGGWQPSLNMNFDLPLAEKTVLEWTIGYSGVRDAVNIVTGNRFIPRHNFLVPNVHRANLNINQFSLQWALEQEIDDKLVLFTHGFYNGGILIQQGSGIMVGAGFFYRISPALLWFGSGNAGLTPELPPVSIQLGLAIAL